MIDKYAKEKQNSEADLKSLIYNNYKTFISLSDNISGVQNFFGSLKKQFSQYDQILDSLEDVLMEDKKIFASKNKKIGALDSSRDFDDAEEEEEDIIERVRRKKENINAINPIKSFSNINQ